jgi:hypothetical protein
MDRFAGQAVCGVANERSKHPSPYIFAILREFGPVPEFRTGVLLASDAPDGVAEALSVLHTCGLLGVK